MLSVRLRPEADVASKGVKEFEEKGGLGGRFLLLTMNNFWSFLFFDPTPAWFREDDNGSVGGFD